METGVEDNEPTATGGWAARGGADRLLTVVALFEDAIDAEAALRSLERGPGSPEQVSLLIRARDVDPGEAVAEGPTAVARSLVATALETVGGWLLGLASLVVPGRGTYLAAGPIGTALAWLGQTEADRTEVVAPAITGRPGPVELDASRLVRTLRGFGFAEDEAIYLEHRLAAGAVLIAVTSGETAQVQAIRQLFADHDAVHLNQGESDDGLPIEATAALAAILRAASEPLESEAGPSTLQRLCDREPGDRLTELCGLDLVDRFGDEAGTIVDLLTDGNGEALGGPSPPVRYVVVGFGGLLGLGRQHVAVPSALVDLVERPAYVAVERKVLHHAPRLAGDATLSRREQLAICAYFGVTPYWLTE
jgi:hypothetical protein